MEEGDAFEGGFTQRKTACIKQLDGIPFLFIIIENLLLFSDDSEKVPTNSHTL